MRQFRVPLALLTILAATAAHAEFTVPRPPATLSPDFRQPWLVQISPTEANRLPRIPEPVQTAAVTPQNYELDPIYLPQMVAYTGTEAPGTIIIDTVNHFLYLVMADGMARRYGVGVARPGFEWAGVHNVTRKEEWPDWYPPEVMRARVPGLPTFMAGGINNPLGARALYLGSTLYRIHGSNEPWTIGQSVSSGCIRMRNEDVIDLYERVGIGTRVIVI
jgi:lipoprotein-anchoring transpeptidase ErfK/SrfK